MPNELVLTSSAPVVNGLPQVNADNASTHAITIQKQDGSGNNISGTEALYVTITSGAINVSNKTPSLVNGQATINIGPTALSQEVMVRIFDQAGVISNGFIRVRFF